MDKNYDAIAFFQKNLILRRLRVAIFAGIIKIVTLFIKTTHKDSRKIKRIRNYVSKWCLYLYFLITNIWQFLVKNSDVSRTQGMCHVIHIDFGSSLSKILLCLPGFIIIRYVWQNLGKGGLFDPHPAPPNQPRKNPS